MLFAINLSRKNVIITGMGNISAPKGAGRLRLRKKAKKPLQTLLKNKIKKKLLVSACLTGIKCTFRHSDNLSTPLKKLAEKGLVLAVCPEIASSFGIPRESVELVGGDGYDVLEGKARVKTASGKDVTKKMVSGARKILALAKKYGIEEAVVKSKSPACGSGWIYDGSFSNKLKKGDGVLTAMLKKNGIKVITEKEF